MATKQKSGLYRARVKIGVDSQGRDVYKYISGKTRKELEQHRQSIISTHIAGNALNDDRLFGAYAVEWFRLRLSAKASVSTRNAYRNALNNHILPVFGDRCLRAIRPLEIQTFINGFAGLSTTSLTYIRAAFRKIYRCALTDRIVDYNPAEYVTLPEATPAAEKRALDPDERKRVERVCATHVSGLYLALMYYLGVRSGEASGCRWEDIDWQRRTIHVQRDIDYKAGGVPGNLKTKKSDRYIPIPAPLYELLKDRRGMPGTYIISGSTPAVPATESQNRRMWSSLMSACGMLEPPKKTTDGKRVRSKPLISPHYLRHNYITMCWESGLDVYTTSRIVGHSNITTTLKIYTHLTDKQQRATAEKIDNMFAQATNIEPNPFDSVSD